MFHFQVLARLLTDLSKGPQKEASHCRVLKEQQIGAVFLQLLEQRLMLDQRASETKVERSDETMHTIRLGCKD